MAVTASTWVAALRPVPAAVTVGVDCERRGVRRARGDAVRELVGGAHVERVLPVGGQRQAVEPADEYFPDLGYFLKASHRGHVGRWFAWKLGTGGHPRRGRLCSELVVGCQLAVTVTTGLAPWQASWSGLPEPTSPLFILTST